MGEGALMVSQSRQDAKECWVVRVRHPERSIANLACRQTGSKDPDERRSILVFHEMFRLV